MLRSIFKVSSSLLIFALCSGQVKAQIDQAIPGSYSNLEYDERGKLILTYEGEEIQSVQPAESFTLDKVMPDVNGTETGLLFRFATDIKGKLIYGFIKYGDGRFPMPVFRKEEIPINEGVAALSFDNLRGSQDMIDWQENKMGTIGYRLIDHSGAILFDGKTAFVGNGPFKVVNAIWEGPLIQSLDVGGCILSFKTTHTSKCKIWVDGKHYEDAVETIHHVFKIADLAPGKKYVYKVICQPGFEQEYHFTTPPENGSRKPFTFAYLSDSRNGGGGGERNIYGLNAYIMKKVMAVCLANDATFMQFTGDLITGHQNIGDALLQYANWKVTLTPFWHYLPVYPGVGNHEKIAYEFDLPNSSKRYNIDRFPFKTLSTEAIFAEQFILPENGPDSEDGNAYDPFADQQDFPSYKENVFYYTYANVAMVVLNTHYWYSSKIDPETPLGGNPHGYIMDNQLQWLRETLSKLELDKKIDHIFVTCHTPFLPNSGHVGDGMWHHGNNAMRPVIAGQPVQKGMIERRDELLDLLVNRSRKLVAILTGDEHNYCRTAIGPDTPMYPDGYVGAKLTLDRTIYQINNGSAGAPYQAQVQVPWSAFTTKFTTQYAVCLFDVKGRKISMRVINPDTLEEIERMVLN